MKIKSIGLILAIILVSCKSGKEGERELRSIESGLFEVTSINGERINDEKVTMKIDLDKHQVSGNTGCNSYSADFITVNWTINIGYARVTKRYCEGQMKTERRFLENLKNTKSYIYNGKELQLQSEKREDIITAELIKNKTDKI